MAASAFSHLHVHSEYSLLRSMARIPDLIRKAKELGQTALALTDHGNMFGMLEFYTAAKKAGLKPIVGCDLYMAPDARRNQNYAAGQPAWHQVVALVENETGYRHLLALCSAGHLEGFHQKPRIDRAAIEQWHEGLFFLLPNVDSEPGHHVLHGQEKKAREVLDFFAATCGQERVFLVVQDHGRPEEKEVNRFFLNLHREAGWPLLAANDVHYVDRQDAEAHDVMLCIEGGWRHAEKHRPRFASDQYFLRSSEEMAALCAEFPGAVENTARLAEACNCEITFGHLHLPKFPIPKGFTDNDAYLVHLAEAGLLRRYADPGPELRARLAFEIDTMKRMQLAGYMLIVQDFIIAAKARGFPVGPGRGSAAGSLVCYVLGITDVDPVRYGLLFERFLNPERVSMPDIDTDFSDHDRQAVIQYVVEKYGQDAVAQIVTYGRMKAKMVLRDVGRVLGFEPQRMNQLCKLFPPNPFATLTEALAQSPGLKKEIDAEPGLQNLVQLALKLEGLVRQAGMHAAAVIIAPEAVVHFAPLFRQPGSDQVMIQYDKTFSEDIGLLKMDFLGLRNLSVIQDCIAQIRANHGVDVDPLGLPEGDAQTYALLGKGQTVAVFQFESAGMQDYLRKLKPGSLEDMIAMNALYRPGPMEFIGQFIARKHGQETVDCYHRDLEAILKETYGVIVYQEQVMQIAQVLAGFTLGGADLLRRAMGKKDEKKMKDLKPKFIGGAKERGYDPALAERIWEVLVPFSSYAFNKSHSAAYATIAYQTAYLKAHYPAEFMAANMNSEMHDTTRLVVLLNDCRQMHITVRFPDINRSDATFKARDGEIVYGLAGIKNVGVAAVECIVAEREKQGPFASLGDLCKRVDAHVLNRRALESLILAGALPDEISGNRAQQFAAVEGVMAWAAGQQTDRELGQVSLFESGGTALEAGEPPLPAVDPWPYPEMLDKEKEVLGLYLSGHPLEPFRAELEAFASAPLDPDRLNALVPPTAAASDTEPAPRKFGKPSGPKNEVILGGMITRLKTRISPKDNRTFAFADLEDFTGKVDVTFWAEVFETVRPLVEIDAMVLIRGELKWDADRGIYKLIASKVLPLSEARERLAKSVHLRFHADGLGRDRLEQLQTLCAGLAGACRLVFHVDTRKAPVEVLSDGYRVRPDADALDQLTEWAGPGNVWLSAKAYA